MKKILAILLPLGLAACASNKISKDDCLEANYYEMGLKDGKDGKGTERLDQYRNSCGASGVAVSEDSYRRGRTVGLADYCDEGRAEKDAKKNSKDSICLKEKVPPYVAAYNRELEKHRDDWNEELSEVQKKKAELQARESELQGQINAIDQQKASAE